MADSASKVRESDRKNVEILPKEGVFYVNEAEVDVARATVRRNGIEIPLRPKTYRVLLFMLARRDRLVSKDELIEGVWEGLAVSDDVLARSISELRKAFDDDPKNPKIFRTHPKLGYSVVARVVDSEIPAAPPDLAAAPEAEAIALEPAPPASKAKWILAAALIFLLAAIVAVLKRPVAPPAPEPNRGEVAWWKLDEGQGAAVHDASGHGLDGVIRGEVAWTPDRTGSRSVVSFNGLQSAVDGSARGALPVDDAPRTATAWFKATRPRVDDTVIFEYNSDRHDPPAPHFVVFLRRDGRITAIAVTTAAQFADEAWHMVAAVYDGAPSDLVHIYVDGQLDATGRVPWPLVTRADATWKIGQGAFGGSAFRGAINDVRVFERALSPAEVVSIYRCSAGVDDVDGDYFMPIFLDGIAFERGATSIDLHNSGTNWTGMQLAKAESACAMAGIRGADAGQDLRISVDLLVPSDATGNVSDAGPYFRSRRAHPGDGLIGGTSAGYWVQLYSTGSVRVKRLNRQAVVAFSGPVDRFDSSIFHHLDVEARGDSLQVWLDHHIVVFDQSNHQGATVPIPSTWDGPPKVGKNEGAAGVAFSDEENKGHMGGQRAKNLKVTRLK